MGASHSNEAAHWEEIRHAENLEKERRQRLEEENLALQQRQRELEREKATLDLEVRQLHPTHLRKTSDAILEIKREMFGESDSHINVAVVGLSGTGKSTLINRLRKVPDNLPGAAPCGEVETTNTSTMYDLPSMPFIRLWDFPGGNTAAHPERFYFDILRLYAFDALIINATDFLSDLDVQLCSLAALYSLPVALLRNKADLALEAKLRRKDFTLPHDALAQLREEFHASLSRNLKDDSPVNSGLISTFIVSNHEMDIEQSPLPQPFADNARLLDWLTQLAS
ncbi:g9153 [Coccomyxa elongata]